MSRATGSAGASGSPPTPLLTRHGRRGASPRLLLPLIGVISGALLLVVIAASVSGVTRAVILAALTPLLVLTTLLLWRSARATVTASYVRRATIAAMRSRNVVGVLAIAPLDADAATSRQADEWAGWAERLALATAPGIASATPSNANSARGQQALGLLHDLLGEARPGGEAPLPLPRRTTLAIVDGSDDVHIWDVSSLLAQARAGGSAAEAAQADLVELELHVMRMVA